MKRRNHVRFFATAGALALSTAALAQTTPAGAPVAEEPTAETPAATPANPTAADIVVTGSRLTRAGFEAPTPVTVVSTASLAAKAPSNLPDALNQLPVFQNSISQNSGDSAQSNRVRSGNYLNLRALGPNRLLVLQDGRRVPPTSSNGGTDANLIPQLLVDRIDVVTGGASAAYGSDAVSGVVNFILNKKFEGLKANIQSGVSTYKDNFSYRAGLAGGVALLDDRLRIIGSAERYHSDGITSRIDRPGGRNFDSYGGVGTAASPYAFYSNVHYSATADGGYILNGPLAGRQFLLGGQTGAFNPGTAIGRSGVAINGDGADFDPTFSSLVPTLTTDQFFGRISYEFSSNVRAFAEGSYNIGVNDDHNITFIRLGSTMTIFRDNAYLPANVLAALGNTASFNVSRSFDEFGGLYSKQRTTSFNMATGLEGNFGDSWKWDVSYVHGDTKFRNVTQEPDLRRFYASLDAVRNSAGNIVCRITVTNPGVMDNCLPMNTFGNGAITRQAWDSVLQDSIWATRNKMDIWAANISGEPIELWAGPLSVAVGAEYRKQSILQTSNSNPAIPQDLTGIRGFSGTTRFFYVSIGEARGSYNIKEGYIEASLPLLKDSPLGKAMELNGALRYTDYSTSGSVKTWKVGLTYQPITDIRLRGTVSRDIRAPSLFELFAGQTVNNVPISDPLTGGFGSVPTVSGGNAALVPEVAKTYTGGIVLSPSFVRGLSMSFDYFNIAIDGAVSVPYNGSTLVNLCFASGGASPLCGQITRPLGNTNASAANFPTLITVTNQNVSRLQTSGVDFEVGYRHPLAGGTLNGRVLGTRLISYKRQQAAGQPTIEYAGTADLPGFNSNIASPKWRANFELNYASDSLSLGIQERMIGSYKKSKQSVYVDNGAPTVFYTDANISYAFPMGTGSGKIELFATMNNVFNRKAPYWPQTGSPGLQLPSLRTLYDINGRYMTVGARARF
ncbi:TonB-dependent receptor [Sphingomonas naphthae]|uniref:TonB-dependent receptor n=1 Tax=Sphingomonas naphthae TaxID=1813468 RepID=A0ABY7TLM9_9SPHN|nr:TonB-dependent receptor [Sphingomonas naphthae]WCT74147.1 TonB-dependent receptor [Sphingomonas naphthae]